MTGTLSSRTMNGTAGRGVGNLAHGSAGVDVLTGEGLAEAVAAADVLVDVTNSPSFEDEPVMAFFIASSRNPAEAAKTAGVGHYVALSIVGAEGKPDSGYMRAKVVQERTITQSGLRPRRSCALPSSTSSPT